MFEVTMKVFKAVRGAMGEVVMFGLGAFLVTGLFIGLGAGQAGGALGIGGAGNVRVRGAPTQETEKCGRTATRYRYAAEHKWRQGVGHGHS